MSFTLEIGNADAVADTVGKMIGRITYLGAVEMPKEMGDWETKDVHRKRPGKKRKKWRRGSTQVQTLFRPHSKYETQQSTLYQRRLLRRLRRATGRKIITDFIQLKRSNRPILRASLIEQLGSRMARALFESVSWK